MLIEGWSTLAIGLTSLAPLSSSSLELLLLPEVLELLLELELSLELELEPLTVLVL